MSAAKLGLLAALVLAAPAGAAPLQAPRPEAAAATPSTGQGGGRIVIRRGEVSEFDAQGSGLAFVTGERVRIPAQVAGDIFAAGRELTVAGANADHLFLAGREIDLAPAALRDLIAAGARIRLRSGAVSDDVVAAGREISLDRAARIGGSAVLLGRRLDVEAPVGRALMAGGGRVELNGPVAGDARIHADEVVIGPGARIGGDLHLRGKRIEVSPGAVVQGLTTREVVKPENRSAKLLPAILFALGVLIMVGVVAAAAPTLMERVEGHIRSRFWATLGIGVLILVLGPPLILVLLATVLGAPLAVLLAAAYLLAAPLAFAGVSHALGQLIRGRIARAHAATPPGPAARARWAALAALLLMLLFMIPVLGALVWLLVVATGMGALAAQLVRRRAEPVPTPA